MGKTTQEKIDVMQACADGKNIEFRYIGGVKGFASYKRGEVDWKDSLVVRPNHVK